MTTRNEIIVCQSGIFGAWEIKTCFTIINRWKLRKFSNVRSNMKLFIKILKEYLEMETEKARWKTKFWIDSIMDSLIQKTELKHHSCHINIKGKMDCDNYQSGLDFYYCNLSFVLIKIFLIFSPTESKSTILIKCLTYFL